MNRTLVPLIASIEFTTDSPAIMRNQLALPFRACKTRNFCSTAADSLVAAGVSLYPGSAIRGPRLQIEFLRPRKGNTAAKKTSEKSANGDQRLGNRSYFTNFDGGDAGILQRACERVCIFGGNRDQQTSGGLGVEEQRADVGGNR